MLKILYICTHNRCRSILSEAMTNQMGAEYFVAKSAGSQPVGEVHPLSIHYLEEASVSTKGLCSQSWDAFETFQPDVVITVCDSAAQEVCPLWMGDSTVLHWALKDPSKLQGSPEDVAAAFRECIAEIESRINALIEYLGKEGVSRASLLQGLHQLGASAR